MHYPDHHRYETGDDGGNLGGMARAGGMTRAGGKPHRGQREGKKGGKKEEEKKEKREKKKKKKMHLQWIFGDSGAGRCW